MMNSCLSFCAVLLLACVTCVHSSWSNEEYERRLKTVMDTDVEEELFSNKENVFVQENESSGSGDHNTDPSNAPSNVLARSEVSLIVIASFIGLAVVALLVSCVWHKISPRQRKYVFNSFYNDNEENQMLYMVDYDNIKGIDNGKFTLTFTQQDYETSWLQN